MEHTTGHYIEMFVIMILSGLLSTMNVWVDKMDDMRISLNDVYMVLLMSGWMFFLMGSSNNNMNVSLIGIVLIASSIYAIRTQFMITQDQYLTGMIPHHSMAVHMSKRMLEKKNNVQVLLNKIINSQEEEIKYMKENL